MDLVFQLLKRLIFNARWCNILLCLFIFSNRIMYPILLGWEVSRSCRTESLLFKYVCLCLIVLCFVQVCLYMLIVLCWYLRLAVIVTFSTLFYKFTFTQVKISNIFAGNKRLCGKNVKKIRGEDSWKSEHHLVFYYYYLFLLPLALWYYLARDLLLFLCSINFIF